jgi:hypothetical protein
MKASSRTVLAIGGAVVLVAGLVVALLLASGDSETSGASAAPAETEYAYALYSVEIPAKWEQLTRDEPTNGHLESIWRYPGKPRASVLIEAKVPVLESPIQAARAVRANISRIPGYRQVSFGPISLDGQPAARWVFEVEGDRRVYYFFNECEVAMTVRNATTPANFASQAETFHDIASSVAVRCV